MRVALNGTSMGLRDAMALRWSRGLFRLWLIASVLWIAAIGVASWRFDWIPSLTRFVAQTAKPPLDDLPDAPWLKEGCPPNWMRDKPGGECSPKWARDHAETTKPPFDPTNPYQIVRDTERWDTIRNASMMALIPPPIVLLFGWAVIWALRGFRA
jgi:hypothetical protein